MPPVSPRDVFAGLLAVRHQHLDAKMLADALSAWANDGYRPLADVLAERLPGEDWSRLLAEADEFLARTHGPHDTPPLLRDDSAIADTRPPEPGDVFLAAPATGDPLLQVRFVKGEKLGEGGMGIVFKARDESLGRTTALKEIKGDPSLDRNTQARFWREAGVAGQLEHPGIVPVYGLGRYPDGRPFYVMRRIKGLSLEQAIKEFHAADVPGRDRSERERSLRDLLGRFVSVCYTIEYVHSQRFVHRDIKPENVMLGRYNETFVVDWGLVKPIPASGELDSAPVGQSSLPRVPDGPTTKTHGSVGTPAYMPPEQVWAPDRVGSRSDVYSLGATLYQLLTGVVPFTGNTVEEILAKVVSGKYAPADQVNPRVHAALAAICRRAMATEAGDRYPSAEALAEEIKNWMADEPVTAYRDPLSVRWLRVARRYRTGVTTGLVALLVATATLAAGLLLVNREKGKTEKERDEAKQNLDRAIQAEQLAQKNRELAIQGRDLLVRKAGATDAAGSKREAIIGYEEARDLFQRLVKQEPRVAEHRSGLALVLNELGNLYRATGRHDDALESYSQALALRRKLAQDYPDSGTYRNDVAATLAQLGTLAAMSSKPVDARRHYEEAREIGEALVQQDSGTREYRATLAKTLHLLGSLYRTLDRRADALACHERARDLQVRLVGDHHQVAEYRAALADSMISLAILSQDREEAATALPYYEQARDLRQQLVKDSPEITAYRDGLAVVLTNLGSVYADLKRRKEALASQEQALALRERLATEHPDLDQFQFRLALVLNNLGELYTEMGRLKDALTTFERSRDVRRTLLAKRPGVIAYRAGLAIVLSNLAGAQVKMGEPDKALEPLDEAISLMTQVRKSESKNPVYNLYERNIRRTRAKALTDLGRHRDAVAEWDAVIRIEGDSRQRDLWSLARAAAVTRGGDYRSALASVEKLLANPPQEGLIDSARVLALASAAVGESKLPEAERRKLADQHATAALGLLTRAQKAGQLASGEAIEAHKKDRDFASLRGRDDYKKWLEKLEPRPES